MRNSKYLLPETLKVFWQPQINIPEARAASFAKTAPESP